MFDEIHIVMAASYTSRVMIYNAGGAPEVVKGNSKACVLKGYKSSERVVALLSKVTDSGVK